MSPSPKKQVFRVSVFALICFVAIMLANYFRYPSWIEALGTASALIIGGIIAGILAAKRLAYELRELRQAQLHEANKNNTHEENSESSNNQ